jgi:hypothetical protein
MKLADHRVAGIADALIAFRKQFIGGNESE